MKRIIYTLGFILCLFFYGAKAQVSITATTSCLADTLTATLTGLTPVSAGITADDGWSSVIPIGFNFTFYGNVYNQCIIGSNGCLGFDISYASAYNTWPISSTLATDPGSGDIHNLIAGPWCDVYIPAYGTIMYSTVGTAPNRKFECTWCGCAMYSCTTQWITTQIIIYETTNLAEVHIGHHTYCTSWNGGHAECGVKNSSGTACTVAPGRDYTPDWNTVGEAWRFTPAGTTSYTVSSISYAPVPYASSSIYWYDSTTGAYLGSGTTITVTPSVTTTYMACATGCLDTSRAYITEFPVGTGSISGGVPHISAITFTNPTCGLTNGTIVLHGIRPHQIDSVFETKDGVHLPVFVDSAGTDSLLTFTGLSIGTYSFYVKVGPCPSNVVTVTLTTPILAISGESFTNPTFCGKCDASITLHGLWPGYVASVAYNFDGVPQAYSGTVASDSTLTMTGLCIRNPSSGFTSFVVTIGTCTTPGTPLTLTSPIVEDYGVSPTLCGKRDGYIQLLNLAPDSTYSVTFAGAPGSPYTATVSGGDTLTVMYLSGYTYSSIRASINIANCPAPDITLTNPPVYGYGVNPSLCGQANGYIKLYNLPADSTFIITYSGAPGSPALLTVANDDTLTMPYLTGGAYSTIIAAIHGIQCPVPDITLTYPPINATFSNPTICGKNDGTITLYSLPADSLFRVTFSGPGAGSGDTLKVTGNDSLKIPGLIAGIYPSPYSSIVAIAVNDGASCPLSGTITLTDPPVYASFDTTIKLGCRGDQVTFTTTSNPPGYHNYWSFGDTYTASTNEVSTTHPYNDYPADSGTYIATLVYQTYPGNPACMDTVSEIVHFDHHISAAFSQSDTVVCVNPPTNILFTNNSLGFGLSAAWTFGDGTSSNSYNTTHTYQTGKYYKNEVILTVTDFLGCDSTIMGSVNVIYINIRTEIHDTTVCLAEPLKLITHTENAGIFDNISYAWTPDTSLLVYNDSITYYMGVGVVPYTVTATATKIITTSSSLACQSYDTITIHSNPPLHLTNLTQSQTIMYGKSIQLNADGADYFYWYPDNGTLTNLNINNPVATPLDSTTYIVVGMSTYGCKDTEFVKITIDNDMTTICPSGFTPNGDGLNDKFRVVNLKYEKLVDLKVFDRWGIELFHTSDPKDGWDGTYNGVPQDIGTYYYVVILGLVDGTEKTYRGSVTLVR